MVILQLNYKLLLLLCSIVDDLSGARCYMNGWPSCNIRPSILLSFLLCSPSLFPHFVVGNMKCENQRLAKQGMIT